jgi:hypothetical protein
MDDPYAKIDRAKEHLETLKKQIADLKAAPANSYTLSRYDQLEQGRHIIKLKLKVPTEICLTLGDAVYNMRSALDQTVWSLARLNGIPAKTAWPVMEQWTKSTRNSFNNCTVGVPDSAVCEIQALQPYHGGDNFKTHPLWRLDELCNLDKHRRIPAEGISVEVKIYGIDRADRSSVKLEGTDDGHIVDIPIALKDKVRLDPTGPVDVAFGGDQSGIRENLDTIFEIHKFLTSQVLPRFDRFFT